MSNRTLLFTMVLVLTAGQWSFADDYSLYVKPLLKKRCYACHGGLKQKAGLRLDSGELIRRGSEAGEVINFQKPNSSKLIERITSQDKHTRMPPEGEPLTKEEIDHIRAWIQSGAQSPVNEQHESNPRDHWSFRPPRRPAVPGVAPHWVRTPIDAFVASRYQEEGVRPVAFANKNELIRRLYLDLTGLPPTRDELHAFLNDKRPNAYELVVDDLLSRTTYGERWGRHWMDVWRYSDWYGRRRVPDCLNSYGQIWRWRDWIIRSVNEDKGYDRMVVEMLAADEVCPDEPDNVVATGFIVRNFYRWNYNTWMKDTVEHTGKAFLGLTMNCCHCHDHKYDPISNEEYFRFRAFFEPIEIRHDRVPGEPDPGVYPKYSYGASYKPISSGLVRIMDEKLDAQTFVYTGGESRNIIPDREPVSPGGPAIIGGDSLQITRVKLPARSWYPGVQSYIREEALSAAKKRVDQTVAVLAKAKELVARAKGVTEREAAERTLKVDQLNVEYANESLQAVKLRIAADRIRFEGAAGDSKAAAVQASVQERSANVLAQRVEVARAERALAAAKQLPQEKAAAQIQTATTKLNQEKQKLEVVMKEAAKESSNYTLFGPQYPQHSTGRRTALANWIANKKNPLTARVAVNHVWLRHFGKAIVGTPENFGRSGDLPSHPALLDWLAVELMENGWSLRHIHRLIVTSSVYRLSSSANRCDFASKNRGIDPDNRFLWHFERQRMQAEVARDSILYVAGSLDAKVGGKELSQKAGMSTARRSVYFEHHGEGRMQWLDLFDAADPCDAYKRSTSIRPQQALAMTNSELALREGIHLARRLSSELSHLSAVTNQPFVEATFERLLSRLPSDQELQASLSFLQKQQLLFESVNADPAATPNSSPKTGNSTDLERSANPCLRARESFVQAMFSHTDFVTVR